MQLALDRGEQVGWFDSSEIIAYAIVSAVGIYYFLAHSLTTPEPFIRFDLFKDRNYASSCIFHAVTAGVLMSTMALVSPFLQHVGGHPVMSAGMILSSRGVGTFFAMMMIRSSMRYVEARTTLMIGLGITAYTLYLMSDFTNDTAASTIFFVGALQGFAFGIVFVSVNTVAFLTLPDNLRTYGASFQTLVRNSRARSASRSMIAQLTDGARRSRAELGDFVNPFNDALKMPDVAHTLDHGDRQRPRAGRPDAEHAGADHRLCQRFPHADLAARCARCRSPSSSVRPRPPSATPRKRRRRGGRRRSRRASLRSRRRCAAHARWAARRSDVCTGQQM